MSQSSRGFTLIEVLIVIGIIAILAAVVIVAVNPARQFAQARNTQRWSNVLAMLNAVNQNMVDNRGSWTCAAGAIPSVATNMADPTSDPTGYDICSCIVDTYISSMPLDPTVGSYTDCTTYDSGYTIVQDATSGRITIAASSAEIGESISVSR